MLISYFAMYMFFGAIAGLLAGMLGLGGGIVIVPMLLYGLAWQGMSENINHLALGTSMASIFFTFISSVRAHHRRGSVLWRVVGCFTPGVAVGTFLGGYIAVLLPSRPLSVIFSIFLLLVAAQIFLDITPKAARHLPGRGGLAGVGAGIGFISSFVGIGGGSMTVPFLGWCNIDMRQAVGTAAGIGFPMALAGALSYMINGWNAPNLPEYSLGFIYLPALGGLASTSILFAPLGAKIAYRISAKKLKRVFAVYLVCMAAHMAFGTW
ncbi:MAG: sulfite exporter TauE/SafE family protein [Desulfovibrionaceae bacterium]|nr:sulfite exporter TauE/SafE family protein [Desulfovibrionaceae bacterium]